MIDNIHFLADHPVNGGFQVAPRLRVGYEQIHARRDVQQGFGDGYAVIALARLAVGEVGCGRADFGVAARDYVGGQFAAHQRADARKARVYHAHPDARAGESRVVPCVRAVQRHALACDIAPARRRSLALNRQRRVVGVHWRHNRIYANHAGLLRGAREQAYGRIRLHIARADVARIAAVGAQKVGERGGVGLRVECDRYRIAARNGGGCRRAVRGGYALLYARN